MRTTLVIVVIASCVAIQISKKTAILNNRMLIIIRSTWVPLNEKSTPLVLLLSNTT